jgi:hypothetical protein
LIPSKAIDSLSIARSGDSTICSLWGAVAARHDPRFRVLQFPTKEPDMRKFLAAALLAFSLPLVAEPDPQHRQLLEIEKQLPAHASVAAIRTADPGTAERLDSQLRFLESLARGDSGSPPDRKARNLAVLVDQVRRFPESLTFGAPPALPRTQLADERVARSCEHALAFGLGSGHRVPIEAGESLWFRVDLPDAALIRVSTRSSSIDASLRIYADCRATGDEPITSGDDEFGLQAEVAVPAGKQTFWFARLTNEGDQAGEAAIFATLTATLQGTVRSRVGNQPLNSRQVSLWRVEGKTLVQVTSSFTDSTGNWSLSFVNPGTYAIRTRRAFSEVGLLDQAFSDIACRDSFDFEGCGTPGNRFTPITLSTGETRTIDFRLDAGAAVTGVVRNAQTQVPIAGAQIDATDSSGALNPRNVVTDALGRYRIEGLFPGFAFLAARASGFEGRLFDNVPCAFNACVPSNPAVTPLATSLTTPATANFALPPTGQVRVSITIGGQAVPGTPFFGLEGSLIGAAGQFVARAEVNQGQLHFPSVAPGTYRLRVNSFRTVPQLYQAILCASGNCGVELLQGTPIIVPPNGETVLLAMDLRKLPTVFGTVVEEPSGPPIRDADIELVNTLTGLRNTARTDGSGRYRLESVEPGTYRLGARSQTHADEIFDNIPCEGDPAQCPGATLISITNTSPDFEANFSLRRSGRIEAIVTRSSMANQFANVDFRLLNLTGQVIASYSAALGPGGAVALNDVPPGTHLLVARVPDHAAQVHPLIDCVGTADPPAGCPLTAATPITMASGATVSGIRFDLRRNVGVVPVRVRSSVDGSPLPDVPIDYWSPAGIRISTERTRFDGIAWLGRPQFSSGSTPVFVSTDNRQGFIDEVFNNRPCANGPVFLGLCSLTGATLVAIPETGAGPQIEIELDPRDDLFVNGFEP